MGATSYNRAYLASCLWHFAQIQPDGWTSDTLRTLSEIARSPFERVYKTSSIKV